ncbi:acyl-CoA thioesterase [Thiocystis violacea]|uniref:acyl-CoA thioesterase n=1 Tax=Thiocystis violacea TaxID=13725 RepID=UPI0019049704|nr:acyl-CoA thioesterase [Thiocystis violacea]MBK1721140.1 thioesterase [Thiocystis violacea]
MPDTFEHRIEIRLHDTDAAGRLFFAHLFRHAHDAYEAFMCAAGHPLAELIREGGLLLPLTHAQADYRRAMRHGDRVRVQVQVLELRQRSFSIGYRFLSDQGETLATARTIHVVISEDPSTIPELPSDLRAALSARLAGDPPTE